jgi:hypothetical protein
MTQPEFLKGFAVFAIVIGAAWLSMPYADRMLRAWWFRLVAAIRHAQHAGHGRARWRRVQSDGS